MRPGPDRYTQTKSETKPVCVNYARNEKFLQVKTSAIAIFRFLAQLSVWDLKGFVQP